MQSNIAKYEAKATGPAVVALFEVAAFPTDPKPKDYTQFSRITISDESKGAEIREAWKTLTTELGKETWGGVSVSEGEKVGLGLIAWDSLEVSSAFLFSVDISWEKFC